MSTFPLKIVTPGGLLFDGEAEKLILRTTEGDKAILAKHIDYVAALGTGRATVVDTNGQRRRADCAGGILSVMGGKATVITSSFQWTDGSGI